VCGVVGQLNFSAVIDAEVAARDLEEVVRMRDRIAHRGPDDAGIWQSPDGRVVLGHRRLSIVDLSAAGHQPMGSDDGFVWLTFNGEIYNHAQLRKNLRLDERHHFRGTSDTEVLVQLYDQQGLDLVHAIDGMFAFGLWDGRRRRLALVRDRMGKKPLYYTVTRGRLLFASELKALIEHPDVPRRLDTTALDQYLSFSNVPEPRTLFEGIRKLPAGHLLTCDERGELHVERYWSPLDGPAWDGEVSAADAAQRVGELVEAAVKKRLMADVPVGAFLSGGLDSSTNVALMSRLTSTPLRTFTINFTGFGPAENFNDVPYARQVAKLFGCQHSEIDVTAEEARRFLPDLVLSQDEPLGDPACIPMHFVSRAAHQAGIKVVLVGEGSDEVFCGYPDFPHLFELYRGRWAALRRLPGPVLRLVKRGLEVMGAPGGRVDVVRRAAEDQPLYLGLDVVFFDWEKERLYTEEGRRALRFRATQLAQSWYDEILAVRPAADFAQQMSYIELRNRLPELLLMRVDKFSMAHSLEARAPFLDHTLVSYALSLPAEAKMAGGRTKAVLKDAARAWLPEDVIERKKQGFRVPLPAWLRGELAGWAEDLLRRSPLQKLGLLDFDHILELLARHRAGAADHSFDLWCLINLSGWYEHWFAS
jgi:asparagine synthase (glutamine-hydrolysing)